MTPPPNWNWTTCFWWWLRPGSSSTRHSASSDLSSSWAITSQPSWHHWQHSPRPLSRQSLFWMRQAGMCSKSLVAVQVILINFVFFPRFAYCAEQVKRKPGREVVTFLLVCNLAMWAINTLETNRADSHPIQVSLLFYSILYVKIITGLRLRRTS